VYVAAGGGAAPPTRHEPSFHVSSDEDDSDSDVEVHEAAASSASAASATRGSGAGEDDPLSTGEGAQHHPLGVVGVPIELGDRDSSDEEVTELPPPVFSKTPRRIDDEPAVHAVHNGKFSPQGHAERVKAAEGGGGVGTARVVTLACVIGVVSALLCVFMMLAAGSDATLIEMFYFGEATETVASSGGGVGKVLLGLLYVQVRPHHHHHTTTITTTTTKDKCCHTH
jgi:hypothetical protein